MTRGVAECRELRQPDLAIWERLRGAHQTDKPYISLYQVTLDSSPSEWTLSLEQARPKTRLDGARGRDSHRCQSTVGHSGR